MRKYVEAIPTRSCCASEYQLYVHQSNSYNKYSHGNNDDDIVGAYQTEWMSVRRSVQLDLENWGTLDLTFTPPSYWAGTSYYSLVNTASGRVMGTAEPKGYVTTCWELRLPSSTFQPQDINKNNNRILTLQYAGVLSSDMELLDLNDGGRVVAKVRHRSGCCRGVGWVVVDVDGNGVESDQASLNVVGMVFIGLVFERIAEIRRERSTTAAGALLT